MNLNPSRIDLTTVQNVKDWLTIKAAIPAQAEVNAIQRCITGASAYWLWYCGLLSADQDIPDKSPFVELCDFDELYDGNGSDKLPVRITPIRTISSLIINQRTIQPSTDFNVPGYFIDRSKAFINLRCGVNGVSSTWNGGNFFVKGSSNVHVVYQAGYPFRTVTNERHSIPGAPGPYVLTVDGDWKEDVAVRYFSSGVPLTNVLTAPGPGEYFVDLNTGQYLFNAADAAVDVMITYQVPGTPPDIIEKSTSMVSVNYKRRQWIDQKSQSMAQGAGTISYRDWELPPDVVTVMNAYKRWLPI